MYISPPGSRSRLLIAIRGIDIKFSHRQLTKNSASRAFQQTPIKHHRIVIANVGLQYYYTGNVKSERKWGHIKWFTSWFQLVCEVNEVNLSLYTLWWCDGKPSLYFKKFLHHSLRRHLTESSDGSPSPSSTVLHAGLTLPSCVTYVLLYLVISRHNVYSLCLFVYFLWVMFVHSISVADSGAWWMVDMGSSHCVGTVNVFNRADCCGM